MDAAETAHPHRTVCFTVCLGILFAGHAVTSAQSGYRVLPDNFNADKVGQMMRASLRSQVHAALDRRREELADALESHEQLAAYQKKRSAFLRWTFGEMPERSPLNAQVTGRIHADDFSIEKVLFESQPGFHVTANVYRPIGDGPFPAVLHPVGHSENGKAYAEYQRASRLLVQNGFLVLCYDPIGQGERKQLFGLDGAPLYRASGEHQQLGVAPVLLGRGLGSYMVWDAVRAIDYLCGRSDVDARRIGCTGISGGGNLSSYLMAYDDRIVAAAPGCFITTHRRKNESPGPGDAEQNLFAQIHAGFDHPDFILVRAPRPTRILAATRDFVPIEGTREAYRQARRVYTKLGCPDRIDLVEANAGHGFSRTLREACVQFMARWLQGRRIDVSEEDNVPILADERLQATPEGQVLRLENEQSLLDLFAGYERKLAASRPELTRGVIRKVTGVRPLAEIHPVRVQTVGPGRNGAAPHPADAPRKLIFHPEPGIVLPALYWPAGDSTPVLLAPSDGMNSAVRDAERFQQQGHPVLIVEVRDTGETRTRNWRFFGADYQIAQMLGRCWLGMRTADLLICARWLQRDTKAESVQLSARGETGPSALHAAALEPQLISTVTTSDSLSAWQQLMTATDAHASQHLAVQGALQYYDLPDLKRLIIRQRQGR